MNSTKPVSYAEQWRVWLLQLLHEGVWLLDGGINCHLKKLKELNNKYVTCILLSETLTCTIEPLLLTVTQSYL